MTVEDGASACRTGVVFISCRYIERCCSLKNIGQKCFRGMTIGRLITVYPLWLACFRFEQMFQVHTAPEADEVLHNESYLYAGWMLEKKECSVSAFFIMPMVIFGRSSSNTSSLTSAYSRTGRSSHYQTDRHAAEFTHSIVSLTSIHHCAKCDEGLIIRQSFMSDLYKTSQCVNLLLRHTLEPPRNRR